MPANKSNLIDPFREQLGKVPDSEIAKEAGVSRTAVIAYRKNRGIGGYEGHKFGSSTRPVPRRAQGGVLYARPSKLDPFRDELGKVPDREIAKKAGVTPENVRTYRVRRGIAAEWPNAPKPRVRRKPTEPPPTPRPVITYAVTIAKGKDEKQVYCVLASDQASAVQQANSYVGKRFPGWRISGIQYVGPFVDERS